MASASSVQGCRASLHGNVVASMVEEVACDADRRRDHLVWSRRWNKVTPASLVEGGLAWHAASVAGCHPQHFWLWCKGVMATSVARLRHGVEVGQSPRLGGAGLQNAPSKSFAWPVPVSTMSTPSCVDPSY
jgi:hypothetical protein